MRARIPELANLALRLALAAAAVRTGHWIAGDTRDYLYESARVCGGFWGGDDIRTPGYFWALCALGPGGTIFAQTILVWLAGLWLARRTTPAIGAFWLFDPGLLIYGAIVMTDALFAVGNLAIALCMQRFLSRGSASAKDAILFGAAAAISILIRVVGIPFGAYCAVFLLAAALRGRVPWRRLGLAAIVAALILSPRLFWVHSRIGQWALATQATGWFDSVAGYVKYYGTGLDPYQSEIRYAQEQGRPPHSSVQVVLEHFPVWCWLTAKSVARVLIGHLNSEWVSFFTGEAPVGPGWFKYTAQPGRLRVSGPWVFPWGLGILATAAYCLYVYRRVATRLLRARPLDLFCWWAIGGIALLAVVPQVWGDARFRTSLWPLVLMLWGQAESRALEERPPIVRE